MIVKTYQDIIASGKCINVNGAFNKCNAIDAEFMALYPSRETGASARFWQPVHGRSKHVAQV